MYYDNFNSTLPGYVLRGAATCGSVTKMRVLALRVLFLCVLALWQPCCCDKLHERYYENTLERLRWLNATIAPGGGFPRSRPWTSKCSTIGKTPTTKQFYKLFKRHHLPFVLKGAVDKGVFGETVKKWRDLDYLATQFGEVDGVRVSVWPPKANRGVQPLRSNDASSTEQPGMLVEPDKKLTSLGEAIDIFKQKRDTAVIEQMALFSAEDPGDPEVLQPEMMEDLQDALPDFLSELNDVITVNLWAGYISPEINKPKV